MEFPVERGARDFWVQFGLRWARGRARISNITMRLDQPAQATLRKGAVAGGVGGDMGLEGAPLAAFAAGCILTGLVWYLSSLLH